MVVVLGDSRSISDILRLRCLTRYGRLAYCLSICLLHLAARNISSHRCRSLNVESLHSYDYFFDFIYVDSRIDPLEPGVPLDDLLNSQIRASVLLPIQHRLQYTCSCNDFWMIVQTQGQLEWIITIDHRNLEELISARIVSKPLAKSMNMNVR